MFKQVGAEASNLNARQAGAGRLQALMFVWLVVLLHAGIPLSGPLDATAATAGRNVRKLAAVPMEAALHVKWVAVKQ